MIRHATRSRWLIAVAAASAIAVTASACSSDSKSNTGGGSSDTKATTKLAAAQLNGSGSTFQQAYDESAIQAFHDANPQVTITYAGGGSGKGQSDLQAGLVDFAGSDGLIKDADKPKYKGEVLYFPFVAAPITVSYNLSGVGKLRLSADTIAKIFQREITSWDDAAIKADNPGTDLPGTAITVAHRSDGSGTTQNFTLYLTKAAPTAWKLGTDKTVNWPSGTQAGNGNAGVAQIVKGTNGAIGYVDFSDARAAGLKFASIKNKAGKYLAPSLAGTSAALETATINPDLGYDPLDAPGADAYPIATPTWIFVYKAQSDAAKGAALKAFLRYILTDGQKIASSVDFAPLPKSLADKAIAQLDEITVP